MNSGADINLRNISRINFRATAKADKINDTMRTRLGLDNRYDPARLAIAYSLALTTPFDSIDEDEDLGKPISGGTLFGDDLLPAWIAMIVESIGEQSISTDLLQKTVRNHWTRGIHLLDKIWKDKEENSSSNTYGDFILFLAEKSGLPQKGIETFETSNKAFNDLPTGAISLKLGELGLDSNTQKAVFWHLNGKGSPHAAFMGSTGTGKSRLAFNMIEQLKKTTNAAFLIFDFAKGDIASNNNLVKALGAKVISCPEKESVPLDVLHISNPTEYNIKSAVMRFRQSFIKIPKGKPGYVQLDDLRDATTNVFNNIKPPYKIEDIQEELKSIYNKSGKTGDTITSTFKDLMQWKLFEPKLSPDKFFEKSWIIDVHLADETAQRLIVFLMLDALYAYVKSLPDSTLDENGNRTLKLVLVIDEARKVLKYGQESLISLIRESRSKGMSIFLISQSPEDFDADEDNYLEQIGFTACFSSKGKSSKVLKACLGKNIDLTGLPHGVAAVRMAGEDNFREVKVW